MTSKEDGELSMPIHFLCNEFATCKVEPEPAKASSTILFLFEEFDIILFNKS